MAFRILQQALIAALLFAVSCHAPPPPNDPSIVIEPSVDAKVQNGTAFDRAVLDIGDARVIELPNIATIRRAGEKGKIVLFMAKTLTFAGHPPELINLAGARRFMGCCYRRDGDTLTIATYGEWDARNEGGAVMQLVAVIPDGITVELRRTLWGPDSAARQWPYRPPLPHGGFWYGPSTPAPGWTPIPSTPDPHHTARPDSQPPPATRPQ